MEFNIGGYKDKILCDVLPMDVCHLLLGRPWQFDRHHSYEIEKDGISFTLTPLKEDDKGKTKKANVMMIGRKEFIKVEEKEDRNLAAHSTLGSSVTSDMKSN